MITSSEASEAGSSSDDGSPRSDDAENTPMRANQLASARAGQRFKYVVHGADVKSMHRTEGTLKVADRGEGNSHSHFLQKRPSAEELK